MNRKLIIMRHAEAADPEKGVDDKLRHLTRYGKGQARTCAVSLLANGHAPDLLIHSTATRILETRDAMLDVWPESPRLLDDGRLYNPPYGLEPANLLHFFQRVMDQADEKYRKLLILTHNPAVAQLAEILNQGFPGILRNNYPSATACVFTSDAPRWYDVGPENSRLEMVIISGEKVVAIKDPQTASHLPEPRGPEAT